MKITIEQLFIIAAIIVVTIFIYYYCKKSNFKLGVGDIPPGSCPSDPVTGGDMYCQPPSGVINPKTYFGVCWGAAGPTNTTCLLRTANNNICGQYATCPGGCLPNNEQWTYCASQCPFIYPPITCPPKN